MNLTFKTFTFVFWISAASNVFAADYPTPTEGDFTIRNFKFTSGETLPELRLHYRTLGKPEKDAQGKTTNAFSRTGSATANRASRATDCTRNFRATVTSTW